MTVSGLLTLRTISANGSLCPLLVAMRYVLRRPVISNQPSLSGQIRDAVSSSPQQAKNCPGLRVSTLMLMSGSGLTSGSPHPVVGSLHSRSTGSGTPAMPDTNARIFAVLLQSGALFHWRFPGSPHRTHHQQYPTGRVHSAVLPNHGDTQRGGGSDRARNGR